jgi:hypothetical protein
MTELAARAEVEKLARELCADPEDLMFLTRAGAHRLAELRSVVSDALFARHEAPLHRVAGLAKVMPVALTAASAESVFGPMLCAKVAGVMETGRAVKLAGHLSPEFLADVAVHLDPRRAGDIVRTLPADLVVAVGRTLLGRGEYLTLGRFLAAAPSDVIRSILDIASNLEVLHVACYAEARDKVEAIIADLPDSRLHGIMRAAADTGRLHEGLSLLTSLGETTQVRMGVIAADLGRTVLDAVIREVQRLDVWADLVPVLGVLTDAARREFVNVPATKEPEVIRAVLVAVRTHGMGGQLLMILMSMDDEHVEALGAVPELHDPAWRRWLHEGAGIPERLVHLVLDSLRNPDSPGTLSSLADHL